MSTSLKILAGILLTIILVGTFIGMKIKSEKNNNFNEIKRDLKGLNNISRSLSVQETGAQVPYKFKVPKNCKILFKEKSITISYINENYVYKTPMNISGPNLTEGDYNLFITRVDNGLRVNVR